VLSALDTNADLSAALRLVDASMQGVDVLRAARYHLLRKPPRPDLVALVHLWWSEPSQAGGGGKAGDLANADPSLRELVQWAVASAVFSIFFL